jgi:hypothetical protein
MRMRRERPRIRKRLQGKVHVPPGGGVLRHLDAADALNISRAAMLESLSGYLSSR